MDLCQSRMYTTRDEAIADMFVSAGIRRCFARVLVCLIRMPGLTSRDIERGTALRQPEVSVALNYLVERNWAEVLESNASKKGRPVRQYRLSSPVHKILDDIEEEKRGAFSAQLDILDQIRLVVEDLPAEIIAR